MLHLPTRSDCRNEVISLTAIKSMKAEDAEWEHIFPADSYKLLYNLYLIESMVENVDNEAEFAYNEMVEKRNWRHDFLLYGGLSQVYNRIFTLSKSINSLHWSDVDKANLAILLRIYLFFMKHIFSAKDKLKMKLNKPEIEFVKILPSEKLDAPILTMSTSLGKLNINDSNELDSFINGPPKLRKSVSGRSLGDGEEKAGLYIYITI